MRIVSLVPSLTHMICDFGLREMVVASTNFCVKPAGLQRSAKVIGGTKDPDISAIRALHPTHILVNEEENKPEHIAMCHDICPTLVTFPRHPAEVPAMLREVGNFLGAPVVAERFATQLERALSRPLPLEMRRSLYFVWRDPYMVAGPDTYISSMMKYGGYLNVAPDNDRYPSMILADAAALDPEVILLSTEPYPFRQRDADRLTAEWPGRVPKILKIDGQLMSWYGTLTIEAIESIDYLVHPFSGEAQPSMR